MYYQPSYSSSPLACLRNNNDYQPPKILHHRVVICAVQTKLVHEVDLTYPSTLASQSGNLNALGWSDRWTLYSKYRRVGQGQSLELISQGGRGRWRIWSSCGPCRSGIKVVRYGVISRPEFKTYTFAEVMVIFWSVIKDHGAKVQQTFEVFSPRTRRFKNYKTSIFDAETCLNPVFL